MDPYIDSAGVTGLAPYSATVYAVGHNVDPELHQIIFSYSEQDMPWVHPTESNYHAGAGIPNQPVYCVMHRALQPARLYFWQAEIRDRNGYSLRTTGPQTFNTPPAQHLFEKGNRFWEYKSSFGTNPIFPTAEALWQACCEYFVWNDDNPLWEDTVISYKGDASHEPVAKMRAMSFNALCTFLGIDPSLWSEWRKRPVFKEVCARVDDIIRTQKFEGAAAGLLNSTLISRDLGLVDRMEHTGKDGAPIDVKNTIELEAENFTRQILNIAKRSEQPVTIVQE